MMDDSYFVELSVREREDLLDAYHNHNIRLALDSHEKEVRH